MGKESVRNTFTIIEGPLRGLLTLSLYLSSFAPAPPTQASEIKPNLPDSSATAPLGTIYFSPPSETEVEVGREATPLPDPIPSPEPNTKPTPEPATEEDLDVIELPGVGKFRRTDVVLEGEASTYSRAGCLGCRDDRKMANGRDLKDGEATMAVAPDGKIPLNSYVLVQNITETEPNEDAEEIPWTVAQATDTGWFQRDLGRVADLTLTTNHFIKGNVRGEGRHPLRVRLTLLEPDFIEATQDSP